MARTPVEFSSVKHEILPADSAEPRIEEIPDKVLWGTDWPSPGVSEMKTNIEKFNALPIREDVKRKILYDNAARLFPSR